MKKMIDIENITKENLTKEFKEELSKLGFVESQKVENKEAVGVLFTYCKRDIDQFNAINEVLIARDREPKSFAKELFSKLINTFINEQISPCISENVNVEDLLETITNLPNGKLLYVSPATKAKVAVELANNNILIDIENVYAVNGIKFGGGLIVDNPIKYYLDVQKVEFKEVSKVCEKHSNYIAMEIQFLIEFGVEVPK